MLLRFLAIVSTLTLLTLGCASEVKSNQPDTKTTPTTVAVTADTAQSGTFKAAEHPTKGTVRVVNEQGKQYLEFDKSFKTDSGPDLFVILHRSATVPVSGVKEQDYVSLARLQKTSGAQRYLVPNNVKLADFKSVAIWCRKFNATFGYAPLAK